MLTPQTLQGLAELLGHLHRLSGIPIALTDAEGRALFPLCAQSAFCAQRQCDRNARALCAACDRDLACRAAAQGTPVHSRCHAGLIKTALPVMEGGHFVAAVICGPLRDDAPAEPQWARACADCGASTQSETLRAAFFALRAASRAELDACARLIHACISEARQPNHPAEPPATDGERLLAYIDRHYAEPLSLDVLCRALSIGRTKLCALARQQSGQSVSQLIAARRVAAARELLESTAAPIHQIAEAVGIPDYNYFTKVFRAQCGVTPRAYRRAEGRA